MEAKDLPDWETFCGEIVNLRNSYGTTFSPLLFRGQPDSEFPLTTTLERAGCEEMSIDDFYRLVTRARPAIETFTGVNWEVPDYSLQLSKSFYDKATFSGVTNFPSAQLYPYLVYLRHHGFPSPLLDWSYSPYVAAFFAFSDLVTKPKTKAQKRSIYVYCEMPEGHKGWAVGEPRIRPIGPYVRSHARHFRQQSDYTMCTAYFGTDRGWRFHPHETVFGSLSDKQDALWKFNIPSTEGGKVLELLNEYNLNAFSLFDSQESLLETMWFREQVVRSK